MLERLLQAILIAGLLCWSAEANAGGGETPATNRIRIAVLTLANVSEDKETAHWQDTVTRMLVGQLESMTSLRLIPDSSESYASCQLELKPGEALTIAMARSVGDLIEAQRIIWGGYQREGVTWRLRVNMLDVATGEASPSLTAVAQDWFDVVSVIREGILGQLKLTASPDERRKMDRRVTKSPEARELLSRTIADINRKGASAKTLETLRRALSLDPESAGIRRVLAQVLSALGDLDEATVQAKAAMNASPESAGGHQTLGEVFQARGILPLAEEEFRVAARLDPDWEDPYLQLGAIYAARGKWEVAVSSLRKAKELAPHHAQGRAELARAYLKNNDQSRGLAELKAAERLYHCDKDLFVAMRLAQSYESLGELPLTLRYYEQALAGTGRSRLNRSSAQQATQKVAKLEARLTPHLLTVTVPKTFTPDQLQTALEEKLTPKELEEVEDPLVSSAEMEAWAKHLVGDTKDDMEKARRLFAGLLRSSKPGSRTRQRTAVEAFRDWLNPQVSLGRVDCVFLYVAMARHVGLPAYVAAVEKDEQGRPVSFLDVGVVIDGKALLIDLKRRWFGVPHQGYRLVNDLEVVGAFLASSEDKTREDLGLKLVPEWAQPHFFVAIYRFSRKEKDAARETLRIGLNMDKTSWAALMAQGFSALADENWRGAAVFFERCLKANPDFANMHFHLGWAYYKQREDAAAKEQFRLYLDGSTDQEFAAAARAALSRLEGD